MFGADALLCLCRGRPCSDAAGYSSTSAAAAASSSTSAAAGYSETNQNRSELPNQSNRASQPNNQSGRTRGGRNLSRYATVRDESSGGGVSRRRGGPVRLRNNTLDSNVVRDSVFTTSHVWYSTAQQRTVTNYPADDGSLAAALNSQYEGGNSGNIDFERGSLSEALDRAVAIGKPLAVYAHDQLSMSTRFFCKSKLYRCSLIDEKFVCWAGDATRRAGKEALIHACRDSLPLPRLAENVATALGRVRDVDFPVLLMVSLVADGEFKVLTSARYAPHSFLSLVNYFHEEHRRQLHNLQTLAE